MKLIMIDDKTFNKLFLRYDNISYAIRIIINTFLDEFAEDEKCNYCSGACEKELTGFCKYDFSYLDTKKEKLPF